MNILYTTCYLDVSGVTKINYDILSRISAEAEIHICTTSCDDGISDKWDDRFRSAFREPFKLWRIAPRDRYKALLHYLQHHRIDIIYVTHSLWLYEHAARLKRDLPQVKIVDSLHVLEPYCFRGGYPDISANRFVHPYIDRSIVISEHLLSYISCHYCVDPAKFVVVRNGIDTGRFRKAPSLSGIFRAEIGVPPNVPLIGFIGRFSMQKRPDIFLEVARQLRDQLEQVCFFMIGGGELVAKSKMFAGKLGIADLVRFVPPRDDIDVVLNSTDMLLVTSSYEGAPLTILEALATGVPVVSSNVGAINEYIGNEWLVTPGYGEVDRFTEAAVKQLQLKVAPPFDRVLYGTESLVSRYAEIFASC